MRTICTAHKVAYVVCVFFLIIKTLCRLIEQLDVSHASEFALYNRVTHLFMRFHLHKNAILHSKER